MRRFHLGPDSVSGTGVVRVRRQWLTGAVLRLPRSGDQVPLLVEVRRHGAATSAAGSRSGPGPVSGPRSETWVRHLGASRLVSVQVHTDSQVRERFGVVEWALLVVDGHTALSLLPAGAALCLGRRRIPLPHWCAPQASAVIRAPGGDRGGRPRFEFRVAVRVPALGVVLTYSGYVEETTDG